MCPSGQVRSWPKAISEWTSLSATHRASCATIGVNWGIALGTSFSGVAGWGFPYSPRDSVTMIVRLHYADGASEDHELKNGQHFADYIRRVDVPGSEFAFALRSQQIRYLAVKPKRPDTIDHIELVKGPDATAPIVMAVTLEGLN